MSVVSRLRIASSGCALAALIAVAPLARADAPADPKPSAGDPKPAEPKSGAGPGGAKPGDPVEPKGASPAAMDEARKHFQTGVLLLQDPAAPRYEEAYREFREAYSLSKSPKVLGNLGLSAMALERDEEALAAYEQYLKEMPNLDAAERAQVEQDVLTLKAVLAHVQLSVYPPGALIVDQRIPVQGRPVTNTYVTDEGKARIGVRQGHHKVVVRLAGYVDSEWEFDIRGGEVLVHQFRLEERRAQSVGTVKSRPVPTGVYIGAGVAGVLAATGLVTSLVALSHPSQYEELNDGRHVDEAKDERASGRTMNVASDVLFGTAFVAAGITAYLYFTRPTVETPQKSAGVVLFPGGVSGRF